MWLSRRVSSAHAADVGVSGAARPGSAGTAVLTARPCVSRWRRLGSWPGLLLVGVSGIAWLVTAVIASGMGAGPGAMGLGVAEFVGVWTLMMAAMMLPSVAPLAVLYRTVADGPSGLVTGQLMAGYLAVWAAFGLVAFALADLGGRAAVASPDAARVVAVVVLVLCAAYQMTSLKERCLVRCRTPLGHLMRYRQWRGAIAPLRIAAEHGAWCVACCWSLMVILLAMGAMDLLAMAVLTVVILVEKLAAPGRWFSVAVGAATIVLAVAVALDPALATGLHVTSGGMPMMVRPR